jgi:hypothetical protein
MLPNLTHANEHHHPGSILRFSLPFLTDSYEEESDFAGNPVIYPWSITKICCACQAKNKGCVSKVEMSP